MFWHFDNVQWTCCSGPPSHAIPKEISLKRSVLLPTPGAINGIEGSFQVKWSNTRLAYLSYLQNGWRILVHFCVCQHAFSAELLLEWSIASQTRQLMLEYLTQFKLKASKLLPYWIIIAVPIHSDFNLHSRVEPRAAFPDWLLLKVSQEKAILILIWFRNMYFSWKCHSRKHLDFP